MLTGFEGQPDSNNNRESKIANFSSVFRRIVRFASNADSRERIRQAKVFEKRAGELPEHDVGGKGRALLASGKKYIEGSHFDTGQKTLESALLPLREYVKGGNRDAYLFLSDPLQELNAVYLRRGLISKAEQAQAEAAVITAEMERLFAPREGLETYNQINAGQGI
jgi:hypothetical protein